MGHLVVPRAMRMFSPVNELDDGHVGLVSLPGLLQLHDTRVPPWPLPEQQMERRATRSSSIYQHVA